MQAEIGDTDRSETDLAGLSDWLTGQKQVLREVYGHTSVCIHTGRFSLVDDAALATKGNFTLVNRFFPESEILITDTVAPGFTVQFTVDIRLYRLLTAHVAAEDLAFGDRGFLKRLLAAGADGVYCQVIGQDLTAGIIRQGKPVFFNKYHARNPEDVLYYLLLSYQAHDLDPKRDPLFISGLVERDSPLFRLVFDYVRHVSMDHVPGEPQLPDTAWPGHYFLNLLNA